MRLITLTILLFWGLWLSAQCLEGNCDNGYGRLKCDCGYVYEGIFKDGLKVKGKLVKEELTYTGDFQFDQAHGKGRVDYTDGSWYEGDFKFSQPDGMGVYFLNNGWTYKGQMKQGNFHGIGMRYKVDEMGRMIESKAGFFEEDVLTGPGLHKVEGKLVYVGMFKENQYHGPGAEYMEEKDSIAPLYFYKKGKRGKRIVIKRMDLGLETKTGIYKNYISNTQWICEYASNGTLKKLVYTMDKKEAIFHQNGESGGGVMMDEEGNQHTVITE